MTSHFNPKLVESSNLRVKHARDTKPQAHKCEFCEGEIKQDELLTVWGFKFCSSYCFSQFKDMYE